MKSIINDVRGIHRITRLYMSARRYKRMQSMNGYTLKCPYRLRQQGASDMMYESRRYIEQWTAR